MWSRLLVSGSVELRTAESVLPEEPGTILPPPPLPSGKLESLYIDSVYDLFGYESGSRS